MPPNPNLPCAEAPCLNPRLSGQTRCAAHHAARARERRAAQARAGAAGPAPPPPPPVDDPEARLKQLAAQDGPSAVTAARALLDYQLKQDAQRPRDDDAVPEEPPIRFVSLPPPLCPHCGRPTDPNGELHGTVWRYLPNGERVHESSPEWAAYLTENPEGERGVVYAAPEREAV